MTTDIAIYCLILFSLFSLLWTPLRVDVIAIAALVWVGLAKLIPQANLFSGFSSLPVIALLSIMILSKSLEKTGLIHWWVNLLIRLNREKESWIYFGFLLTAGTLAAIIQNFGAVALLLPAASLISLRVQIPLQRLLIPMTFCAILGGNLTMTGSSPMLLLNHFVHLPLFLPLPIGLLGLGFGLLYCIYQRDRLFPKPYRDFYENLIKHYRHIYGVEYQLHEIQLSSNSPWVGISIEMVESELPDHLFLLGVQTGKISMFPPRRKTKLAPQSCLALMGPLSLIQSLCEPYGLILKKGLPTFSDLLNPSASGLCEAVIPPSSPLVGTHYKDLHFRRTQGIQLLAIHRGKKSRVGKKIRKSRLKSGDTLLLHGLWAPMREFQNQQHLIWITGNIPDLYPLSKKWPLALLALFASFALVLFFNFSIGFALFVGATLMIAFKLISIDDAYNAIHWKTIFLLACLIPLGEAAQQTGAAHYFAGWIEWMVSGWPLLAILFLLGALSTVLSQLISNMGATILLLPFAQELATALHHKPNIFLLLVALSANNVFTLPTHQANHLVMGPGHYSNRDFIRAGLPVAIFFWLMTVLAVYLGDRWI